MKPYLKRTLAVPGFENLEDALSGKSVAVAGAGGLGGICAYLLCSNGLSALKIADFDTVDLSNLNRQVLYDADETGQLKVRLLERKLKLLDPCFDIQCSGLIDEGNVEDFVKGAALVLGLIDSFSLRILLSRACLKLKIPYLHCAVSGTRGELCLFDYSNLGFVKEKGCYECLTLSFPKDTSEGVLGPCACAMASQAAIFALNFLKDGPQDKAGIFYLFDLQTAGLRKFSLSADPLCSSCRKHHEHHS